MPVERFGNCRKLADRPRDGWAQVLTESQAAATRLEKGNDETVGPDNGIDLGRIQMLGRPAPPCCRIRHQSEPQRRQFIATIDGTNVTRNLDVPESAVKRCELRPKRAAGSVQPPDRPLRKIGSLTLRWARNLLTRFAQVPPTPPINVNMTTSRKPQHHSDVLALGKRPSHTMTVQVSMSASSSIVTITRWMPFVASPAAR